jgi:hypothetical protein
MNGKTTFVKLARIGLVAGALLLLSASAACGGSGSSPYGSSSASTPAPTKASASASGSPESSGAQKQLVITAQDFSFSAGRDQRRKGRHDRHHV